MTKTAEPNKEKKPFNDFFHRIAWGNRKVVERIYTRGIKNSRSFSPSVIDGYPGR